MEDAPVMHPVRASISFIISDGNSAVVTMSGIAKRPPTFKTRDASFKTYCLSGDKLITQIEMITSTTQSPTGRCSISPFKSFFILIRSSSRFNNLLVLKYRFLGKYNISLARVGDSLLHCSIGSNSMCHVFPLKLGLHRARFSDDKTVLIVTFP